MNGTRHQDGVLFHLHAPPAALAALAQTPGLIRALSKILVDANADARAANDALEAASTIS